VIVALLLNLGLIFVHNKSLLLLSHLSVVPLSDLAALKLLLLTLFLFFDFSCVVGDFVLLFLCLKLPLNASVVCVSQRAQVLGKLLLLSNEFLHLRVLCQDLIAETEVGFKLSIFTHVPHFEEAQHVVQTD